MFFYFLIARLISSYPPSPDSCFCNHGATRHFPSTLEEIKEIFIETMDNLIDLMTDDLFE